MIAVLQHGIRDVRVAEMSPPQQGAGEVVVRVRSVTICASDLHMYSEGNVGGVSWDRPFVPGHEAAGLLEDPGGSGLPAGTPVVMDPAIPCRTCDTCQAGDLHLCRSLRFCDLPPVDGAMRELIAWPADRVFAIPTSVDIAAAPLIEPLCVAVHALQLSSSPRGAAASVTGCGAIGLFTLQLLKAAGAETVIATDLVPERLAIARDLGADVTVQVSVQDPVAEILRATGGRGVDIAFEAAGPPDAIQQCLDLVRPGGEVVVIGIPSVDEYRVRASHLRRHELTLRFVRRQRENYPEAIELVSQGRVRLGPLLTHRFPVSQVREAFELAERKRDGAVRVAVTFD